MNAMIDYENELGEILRDAVTHGILAPIEKIYFEHIHFPLHVEEFLSDFGLPLDGVLIENSFCAKLVDVFKPFQFGDNSLWTLGENPVESIFCTSHGEVVSIGCAELTSWACRLDGLVTSSILYRRIWEHFHFMVVTNNFELMDYTMELQKMFKTSVKKHGNLFNSPSDPALVKFEIQLDSDVFSMISLIENRASFEEFVWPPWMGSAIIENGKYEGYYFKQIEKI